MSYGIGRATADILASRGAHVVYASRSHDKLLDAIKGRENSCWAVVMDASDPNSVREGMADAIALLGSLDLVVYCPGMRDASRDFLFDLPYPLMRLT